MALYNPVFEDEFYFDGQHNDGIYNGKNLNVYGYCYQNPILFIDPNGKQAISGALTGFVVGALSEIVAQVGYSMFVNHYSLESSMSKIDKSNVVVAASIGAITGSFTGGYDKIAKLVSDPRAQKVLLYAVEKVIDLVAESIENVAKDYFNDEKITVASVKKAIKGALIEVGIGSIPLTKKFTKRIEKAAEKIVKLKTVVKMRGNNSKYGRQLTEAQAEKFVEGAKEKTQEVIRNATGEANGNYWTKDDK